MLVLFLAGGAVYADSPAEQQPAADGNRKIKATVLGREVPTMHPKAMRTFIIGSLLRKFAEDHHIEPTGQEIDLLIQRMDEANKKSEAFLKEDSEALQAELKNANLPKIQRKEKKKELEKIRQILDALREQKQIDWSQEVLMQSRRREMGRLIMLWKISQALFEKYGGRVIFNRSTPKPAEGFFQLGPEPVDAYRDFLKEQEKNGSFEIFDPSLKDSFWRYFARETMHTYLSEGKGRKAMTVPFRMMAAPPLE